MILTCDPEHIREVFGGLVWAYDTLGNRVTHVVRYDSVKKVYYQQATADDGALILDNTTGKPVEVLKSGELRFVRRDGMPCPELPR